jgi:predicted phosphoribosyltransferase
MSQSAQTLLARVADRCESLATPEPFYGVGGWYLDFTQTTDAEVRALLAEADARPELAGLATPPSKTGASP